MTDARPLIQLKNVSRRYTKGDVIVTALDGVNLSIWPGEFAAIMGRSGSGKTTLMNIIGCLDRPSEGAYLIDGEDATAGGSDRVAALRGRMFGFVFQKYNLLETSSALENVQLPALYSGAPRAARSRRAMDLLESLQLSGRAAHLPSELSGGQQQRVAIARALMNDPLVLLADEPTGALDTGSGREVLEALLALNRKGHTVLVVTHDEDVAAYARRVIRLADGKIVSDDSRLARVTDAVVPRKPPQPAASRATLAADATEAVHMALQSLEKNFFRTALTLLGIVIGVAAVVAMLAIGMGGRERVIEQINSLGPRLLTVYPAAPGTSLTPDDASALSSLQNISAVSASRAGRMTVRYGDRDIETIVQAVGAAFPVVRDWRPSRGVFFTARDDARYASVAVLGRSVAKSLFPPGDDPLGRFVVVRNIPFQVIGVMSGRGMSPGGPNEDDAVFVPVGVGLTRLFGSSYVSDITIKARDLDGIGSVQQATNHLLRARHRAEDFQVRNMAAVLSAATSAQDTLTTMLGAIAAISLLVGGIGVMNIMLVSVTERTREIGIRMAVGARRRDIFLQFNTEAMVVCVVGGALGVLCGITAGMGASLCGVAVSFAVIPAAAAFVCAALIGLIFGYLPARKAARMEPSVALAVE